MDQQSKAKITACRLLAKICRIELGQILQALQEIQNGTAYREIKIPKKSGGTRTAFVPNDNLKTIQRAVLKFLYKFPVDKRMHGFVPKRSIIGNARHHLTREHDFKQTHHCYAGEGEVIVPKWIVRIDLQNAFPSISRDVLTRELSWATAETIRKILAQQPNIAEEEREEVRRQFSRLLSYLSTYNGILLQGTPVAPYLFNLVFYTTGTVRKILKACEEWRELDTPQVSFYGDDITISAAKKKIPDRLIEYIIAEIENDGIFTVNCDKTERTWSKQKAVQVTGITLSKDNYGRPRLSLPQKKLKRMRGKINRAASLVEARIMPEKKIHGFNLETIWGYIAWIESIYKNKSPASVKKPIKEQYQGGNN